MKQGWQVDWKEGVTKGWVGGLEKGAWEGSCR